MLRFRIHKKLPTENGISSLQAAGELKEGEIGVLKGSSGAGKSTILKILAGTMGAEEAIIHWKGRPWVEKASRRSLPTRKRPIGMLFQEVALFPNMTVEANIRFAIRKESDPSPRIEKWIERAGLGDLRHRYPKQLSGGQAQRVGILRALAAEPELLLLDEPFSAVDQENRKSMIQLLEEERKERGFTLLIATHTGSDRELQIDRQWELKGGTLFPKSNVADSPKGVILAGGRSRRMGQDKGLLEWRGRSLLELSLTPLRSVAQNPFLIANDARYQEFGLPIVSDHWPDAGPLGGILTALMATDAERVFVLPCDMPFMEKAVLEELELRSGPGITVAYTARERHPLIGIYPKSFLEEGKELLEAGVRSVQEALDLLETNSVKWVDLSHHQDGGKDPFANMNRPEDLEKALEKEEAPKTPGS